MGAAWLRIGYRLVILGMSPDKINDVWLKTLNKHISFADGANEKVIDLVFYQIHGVNNKNINLPTSVYVNSTI